MYPTYGVPTFSVPTYSDPLAPSSVVYYADVAFTTDGITFASVSGFDVDGNGSFTLDDITFASTGGGFGLGAYTAFSSDSIVFASVSGFHIDGNGLFTTDGITFASVSGFAVDGNGLFTTDGITFASTGGGIGFAAFGDFSTGGITFASVSGFDVDGNGLFTTADIAFASTGGGIGFAAFGDFSTGGITFASVSGFDVDGNGLFATADIAFSSTVQSPGIAGNVSFSIGNIAILAQAGFDVDGDGSFVTDDVLEFEAFAGWGVSAFTAFTLDSIDFETTDFQIIPALTDTEIHEALIRWIAAKTGLTVIKPWQSGLKPARPYVMVNFVNSREIRQFEQFIEYEVLDSLNISGKNELFARPVTEIEWEYSVHVFGNGPTDPLRHLRSIAHMAQSNEPLMPTLVVHEIGSIKNLAVYELEDWEPRAQCFIRLRGTINDGEIIDTIEQAPFNLNRL